MVVLVKPNKFFIYNKVFILNILRTFLFLIENITIQNYIRINNSLVDYFITVKPDNSNLVLNLLLKSSLFNYDQLTNMTAIDNLKLPDYNSNERFSIVYVLTSVSTTSRLVIIVKSKLAQKISSIKNIYASSGWLEREIYDLFGICFYGHENIIRILNDYGFIGHPLQKNFPLTGFVELRYNELTKGVTYRRLIFMQQSRVFKFDSPWVHYSVSGNNEKF